MNRLAYIWKYVIPALLILSTTYVLVQVALTALHDEKKQKFEAFAAVIEHQLHDHPELYSASASVAESYVREHIQPLLDRLFVSNSDLSGSIYLAGTGEIVAMAPKHQLKITLPFPSKNQELKTVQATGAARYYSTFSRLRNMDVYTYSAPVRHNGRTVAVININQSLTSVSKQMQAIYITGTIVAGVALSFLALMWVTEYRRERRLKSEQAKLVRWLRCYIENEDSSGDLIDAKLTLLSGLSREFLKSLHLAQYARRQKKQVLNHLSVGIVTFNANRELQYINPFFAKSTGYTLEELREWTPEIWQKFYTVNDDTDLQSLIDEQGGFENQVVLFKRKDGKEIPFSVTARRLPEFEGESLGVLLICNDLSHEFALTRLEQKAHYMFNSIPLSVVLVDAAQRIEFVNPAACHLFGLGERDILNRALRDAMPWETKEGEPEEHRLFADIDQVLTYGMRGHLSDTKINMRGREYDLEIDLFPIFNPYTAESDGCMILIKDKTVYREWEELSQRVDAHSHYVQMAATIAHEVRNPMTSVRGFLQLLAGEVEGSTQKMYLDVMQTEIDRMNSILSEYLSMARTPQPAWEPLDLTDLVRDTFLLLEGEANYRGVTIQLDTATGCKINGIGRELKQVLINLVRNAFDAFDGQAEPGCIDIALTESAEDGMYHVSVTDNGCGIAEEQLGKIFTPFFTTKAMGTGLGLPVCKKIAESHGGTLRVSSKVGEGTTFTIELPKAEEEPA